jgi:hypothetical protein
LLGPAKRRSTYLCNRLAAPPEDEGDNEPSLGSFDRMTDQDNAEQDDCDSEDADPYEAKQQPPKMTPCA